MERIRQKDRNEKLTQRNSNLDNRGHVTATTKATQKRKKGRGKKVSTRKVVKWQFINDTKIPRIIPIDAYLKTIRDNWDFSSDDDELERKLNQGTVRNIKYNLASSSLWTPLQIFLFYWRPFFWVQISSPYYLIISIL